MNRSRILSVCSVLWFILAGCHNWDCEVPIAALERGIFLESNELRASRRQTVLVWDDRLSQLARRYSKDMADRRFFSHIDPDGRNVRERLWAAGVSFKSAGENLAKITGPLVPAEVLSAWVQSRYHRQTLLTPRYRKTGIGISRTAGGDYYVTQIFLAPFLGSK